MADLVPGGEERGQMILLTGFILAIAFVVLALVVNSAIFTENLATRDQVPGSQDALEYRDEVERTLGDVVVAVNRASDPDATDAEAAVETIATRGGLDQSVRGRVVSVSHVSTDPGTKLAQDGTRNFTSNTTAPDWDLATGVEESRRVRLNLTDIGIDGDTFSLVLDESGTTWKLSVAENAGDVEITVEPPHGTSRTCTRSFSPGLVIDVTAGTVDGEPCPALTRTSDGTRMWYGTGIAGPYDVRFLNGNAVKGTYSLRIGDDSFSPPNSDDFGAAARGEPYHADAVYSMTVTYGFFTPGVTYETELTVAPGEANG